MVSEGSTCKLLMAQLTLIISPPNSSKSLRCPRLHQRPLWLPKLPVKRFVLLAALRRKKTWLVARRQMSRTTRARGSIASTMTVLCELAPVPLH